MNTLDALFLFQHLLKDEQWQKVGFGFGGFQNRDNTVSSLVSVLTSWPGFDTCSLDLKFYLLHLGHSRCLRLQTLHPELVHCLLVHCVEQNCGKKPDFIRTTPQQRRSMFDKKVARSCLPLFLFYKCISSDPPNRIRKSSFCVRALHGRSAERVNVKFISEGTETNRKLGRQVKGIVIVPRFVFACG